MFPNATAAAAAAAACHNSSAGRADLFPVVTYSFIFVVGLLFNLTALRVFLGGGGRSRSQTVVYMSNLALADLLLILTLPVRIFYHLGFAGVPQWLCDLLGLVLKSNMYGSIFLLTCICLDRCLAVTLPLAAAVQRGRKKARLVCLAVWVLTFGASLPIYLSQRKFSREQMCFDNLPRYATRPAVVLPTLLVGFGIPLGLMLVCSLALVRAVRRSAVAQTELVDVGKIQRMVAASLLVFTLSFLPYHAVLGLLALGGDQVSCATLTAYRCCLILACLNAVLDPVAYYFTTDTFRRNVDLGALQNIFPLNSQSSQPLNRTPADGSARL